METIIRPARKEDCKEIRQLIQELADFEEMSDGPKIEVTTLENDGFGSQPLYQSIVAESENKLIGYSIFYMTYSTWSGKTMYLEDLYVTLNYRNKGVGNSLFGAVAKSAVENGCCRIDFCVLSWNPAAEFYKKKGAIDLTEIDKLHHFQLNSENLKKLVEKNEN